MKLNGLRLASFGAAGDVAQSGAGKLGGRWFRENAAGESQ
jgi:hypothetical protein